MGQTGKSLLSWEGKVADHPKPFGQTTQITEHVKIEDLIEVEKNILNLLESLDEKISKLEENKQK